MSSAFDAHKQETGQYGSDRLNSTEGLTITAFGSSANGWGAFQVLAETTFTALTDANNSTGLISEAYPAGTPIYGIFTGTITIEAGGDIILYRRPT